MFYQKAGNPKFRANNSEAKGWANHMGNPHLEKTGYFFGFQPFMFRGVFNSLKD